MTYEIATVALLLAVTAERLGELWLAKKNTAALMANGARETGASHYPLIVALHATWLLGLWALGHDNPLNIGWLAVFALLQVLRVWTLGTLGARWTTRIITVPGEMLVAKGPYRFIKHPNYVVVIGEIAVLPLALGMPVYAVVFSLFNAAILTIRVQAENHALQEASGGPVSGL